MADKIELSPENQKSLFKEFYKANKRLLALAFPNLTADLSNVGGSGNIVVKPRAIAIKDGLTEARVKELVAQHIATIPNSLKESSIVYKWNKTRPAILGTITLNKTFKDASKAYTIAYASNAKILVVGGGDTNKVYYYKDEVYQGAIDAGYAVFGVSITPDGKRLVVGGNTNDLKIYKLVNGEYTLETTITDTTYKFRFAEIDGIGGTIVFNSSYSVENSCRIYEINENGVWLKIKQFKVSYPGISSPGYPRGMAFSKDGLDLYITSFYDTTRKGLVGYMQKVDDVWSGISYDKIPVAPNQTVYVGYVDMELSLDKQVLYISDTSVSTKGSVHKYIKKEDGSWEFKSTIALNEDTVGFGVGVASDFENSLLYIATTNGTVYKYDIVEVSTNLDANSLDPFGDGSLKHFYKFDGDTKDSVGGANLPNNGISYLQGKYGQGVVGTEKVAVDLPTTIQTNFTVSFFATYRNITSFAVSFGNSDSNWDETRFVIHSHDSNSIFVGTDIATREQVFGIPIKMSHFLTTIEGTTMKLYVDGVVVLTKEVTASNGLNRLLLGGYGNTGNLHLGDTIDHLQIFNRVLNQEEVTKLYTATSDEVVEPVVEPVVKYLYEDNFTTDKGYLLANGASLGSGYIDVVEGHATLCSVPIPVLTNGTRYRATVSYTDITITEVGNEYPFLEGFLFTNDEVKYLNLFAGDRSVSNYEGKTVSVEFTANENHDNFQFKCRDTAKLTTHITNLKIEEV